MLNTSLFAPMEPNDPEFSLLSKSFGNSSLKLGVVIKSYPITDKFNITKTAPEYDVMTTESNGSMSQKVVTYRNCLAIDSFGGIADFFQVNLRTPTDSSKVQKSGSIHKQDGTIVIMLCLDGNAEKGVIIGSMPNPNRKVVIEEADKPHMEGEFNGVHWEIKQDGSFQVVVRGPTDNKGKPTKEIGATIQVEADGSVELNNKGLWYKGGYDLEDKTELKEPTDPYDSIRMDKTKKAISLFARENVDIKSDKTLAITSKEASSITAKDLTISVEGNATVKAMKGFDLATDGSLKLKGKDGNIELSGPLMIKASQVTIDAPKINLGQGGSPAVIMTTKFQGVGFAGTPVISSAIGPFSSAVFMK